MNQTDTRSSFNVTTLFSREILIYSKQRPRKELSSPSPAGDVVRVLVVVEGINDIEFLRRISSMLHAHDPSLPHLADMEQRGELIFIPCGGGEIAAWTDRLAPLAKPEFYIFDRELPPETDCRLKAAEAANRRDRCRAVLTRKRSLENYLHPRAIHAASDITVDFGDWDSVAEVIARQRYLPDIDGKPWELLSRRARRRLIYRTKRWLNRRAVDQMTIELLRARS